MAYNIKWFTKAFGDDNTPTAEGREQTSTVAQIIRDLDPDIIGITEAPDTSMGDRNTIAALTNFAAEFGLRQSAAVTGFISAGQQEIAALYDPEKLEVEHKPGGQGDSKTNPPFNEEFRVDSDEDGIFEIYKHYRPPLELKVTETGTGKAFRMIVVHAKSKGVFSSNDKVNFDRISERNRRKLFAEASSIRRRVDELLDDDIPVIVLGDVNDGPGRDFYEQKFGRSAVEIIMGSIFAPERILRNPVGEPKWTPNGWEPSSARFRDQFTGDRVNVLIDHIMASHHFTVSQAQVWNPWEVDRIEDKKDVYSAASDHMPITIDIE